MRGVLQGLSAGLIALTFATSQASAYDVLSDVMQKDFEVNNAATVFRAGNFESLDAKIANFAHFGQTTNQGDWYLTSQFDGLARVVDEALDDAELDEIEAQAEAWVHAFPTSASSYLGQATILIQRGLRAAQGRALPKETIARVRKLLDENRSIVEANPHYHAILVRLAVAEDADLATLTPLIEDATRASPSYSAPWLLAAEHLLARGSDGADQLEALARLVMDRTRSKEGAAQYTRIYQHALEVAYGSELFKASKASWPDLKAGMARLAERFPQSGLNMNEFALMACLAGDRDALKPLIKSIEGIGVTPPASIWGDLSFFEQCRSWSAGQATARKPLRPESPMALQLAQQRLAYDPQKRLTAGYEEAVRVRLRNQLSDLVFEPGYRSLEQLSHKYRSSRSRTPSGLSMLTIFYSGFDNMYGPRIEENYEIVEQQLKSYLAAFPDSPTAIVLSAELQIAKARIMRSRKDAQGNIDAFALKAGNVLIEQSVAFLEDHKDFGQTDPHWYMQMITARSLTGATSDQILALVEEGARNHPGNFQIIFSGLATVLETTRPSAHDVRNVIDDYVDRILKLVPEAERPALYARIYWYAEQKYFGYGLFQYTNADWPKMRQGFEDMLKSYPGGWNENAFAYFSCLAGDAAKLRELLPTITAYREEPPFQIWQSLEIRNACLEFARSAPVEVNPASNTDPEQNPT